MRVFVGYYGIVEKSNGFRSKGFHRGYVTETEIKINSICINKLINIVIVVYERETKTISNVYLCWFIL